MCCLRHPQYRWDDRQIQPRPYLSVGGNSEGKQRMLHNPSTLQKSRQSPPTAPPGAMPTPTRAAPPPRTRTRKQMDQGTPEPCSPLTRPPRRPRSSTDYRADAKEVPLDITQKKTPGIRSLLRVTKAQEVHQPAHRHATNPLPPTLGSFRDGRPRHGSEVGSWEQTSPCCSGQPAKSCSPIHYPTRPRRMWPRNLLNCC